MPHYCLRPQDGTAHDSYWVLASTEEEARRLIGLNAAPSATNPEKYDCLVDNKHMPPLGVILKGDGHTITISQR